MVCLDFNIDMIRSLMDQQGLKQKDLVPYIGSEARVSKVLNRKRNLTLSMIRELSRGLQIPVEQLVFTDYPSDAVPCPEHRTHAAS